MKRLMLVCLMILALCLSVSFAEDESTSLYPIRENGLWGYINELAEWVIPPQYDYAESFRDGLALVEQDGKMLYIDHDGTVVWEEE